MTHEDATGHIPEPRKVPGRLQCRAERRINEVRDDVLLEDKVSIRKGRTTHEERCQVRQRDNVSGRKSIRIITVTVRRGCTKCMYNSTGGLHIAAC